MATRVKRAQVTTMESPAKPATFPSAPKKNGHANSDLESAIRARAYEIYERRGRYDGYAQDDWLQAEAEVVSRVSRTA
jgi:hypothetical protein